MQLNEYHLNQPQQLDEGIVGAQAIIADEL
jgi:hypothetical protein